MNNSKIYEINEHLKNINPENVFVKNISLLRQKHKENPDVSLSVRLSELSNTSIGGFHAPEEDHVEFLQFMKDLADDGLALFYMEGM